METGCKVQGCKKAYRAKGYCDFHYKKWRKGELPKFRYKICGMENCKKPMFKDGICKEHFDAMINEKSKAKAAPVQEAAQAAAPAPAPAETKPAEKAQEASPKV